jgi:mercuric ion transport protein
MKDATLIRIGVVGAIVAALCCVTPMLVILLGAVGLAAVTGYLDVVLVPAMALFVGLIVYGVYRRNRTLKAADKQ